MSWRESLRPVTMERIALVSQESRLQDTLREVSECGTVELDDPPTDLTQLNAVVRGPIAGLTGWVPTARLAELRDRLAAVGAAAVRLRKPPGVQPPTLLRKEGRGRSFTPLLETYTTVPYTDVDPTVIAGLAYVLMFGIMFGDLGHGLVLLAAAVVVRNGRWHRLASIRKTWPFIAGAGAASSLFGVLYGEAFGPTGLVPTLWLNPMDEPIPLLLAAIGAGAVLLGGAYALGTINRLREGGWGYALYARTGVAGALLFVALGLAAVGLYLGGLVLLIAAVVLTVVGLGLAAVGLYVVTEGGVTGVVETAVELFDLIVRLGTNLLSFARLAAFGLAHAALGMLVWQGTTALWGSGAFAGLLAGVLFLAGNVVAFTLEALVAGIQALRLEYYELLSKVFETEGRPFRPWRLPEAAGPGSVPESLTEVVSK